MSTQLNKIVVFVGKNRKGTHSREGYSDEHGQVYLPPKKAKAVKAWEKKMAEKGFVL